jgi:hypothetical protein
MINKTAGLWAVLFTQNERGELAKSAWGHSITGELDQSKKFQVGDRIRMAKKDNNNVLRRFKHISCPS